MSTLKQQIAAVRKSSKNAHAKATLALYQTNQYYSSGQIRAMDRHAQTLRDAATTLLAIQLVGERKIEMLPKLLERCNMLVTSFNEKPPGTISHDSILYHIQRLTNLLNDFNSESTRKKIIEKPRQ